MIVKDEWLEHIKNAKTPQKAWNMLAKIFARMNYAKLQCLENKLLSISQKNLIIGQYFPKVKFLCNEVSKLDPQNAVTKIRMRIIIIHRLRPKSNKIVMITHE